MPYYVTPNPQPKLTVKRVILEETDEQLIFAPARLFGAMLPTKRTPPPAEAQVQMSPALPPLDSDEFADYLHAWHREHNPEP